MPLSDQATSETPRVPQESSDNGHGVARVEETNGRLSRENEQHGASDGDNDTARQRGHDGGQRNGNGHRYRRNRCEAWIRRHRTTIEIVLAAVLTVFTVVLAIVACLQRQVMSETNRISSDANRIQKIA